MNKDIGIENQIKSFAMNNSMLLEELLKIQKEFNIDVGVEKKEDSHIEDNYYSQFDLIHRSQAKLMSKHYELFFCLEKTIRELVAKSIADIEGITDWWETQRVLDDIKKEVKNRITKEVDSGVTRRSNEELDYTTFGELSQIITSNWDIFGSIFTSKKAVEKIMASLNTLRGPIAHCSLLSEDEVLRLKLTIRDWFRLME
jgi:membrane-associated protease RseP (regulator of RpoE activity)